MMMKRNMSLEDRTMRPIVAMALVGFCFSERISPLAKGALLAISTALVLTSITGKSLVYKATKINTRKTWENGAQKLFT